MHLIKTARDMIYDLENGRLYTNNGNSIAMFDSPTSLGVSIAEDSYDEVERSWNHMSCLCKHDATVEVSPEQIETEMREDNFRRWEALDKERGVLVDLKPSPFAPFSEDRLRVKFDVGQPIKVREDVDGEASPYAGRSGRVVRIARMPSGVPYYVTDLTTTPLSASELEPAD